MERFSSRMGMLLSILGIAVGTGNIWRFPRIAAQNGGEEGAGAFLIAWAVFLFMWSIPLIIAEYGIGRQGRMGVIGSFMKLAGEKFAWMGSFIGFVATAIMFYYSVVAGWCLFYLGQALFQPLPATIEEATLVWDGFQNSIYPSIFHGIIMVLGGVIILNGVRSIERINRLLIPSLLLVLLISFVKAVSIDGAFEGIRYLFTPDWSTLSKPQIWIEALTQNAWDTGAAWGLILTYAAYMRSQDNITISAFQTGIGNNIVSLLAAVILFSTVFGTLGGVMSDGEILDVMKTSGPASTGLTFMWMPQLFQLMSGGKAFAVLFFLGLTFAAFSSLISMIELAAKVLIDSGLNRKKATIIVCTIGFLMGLPSATNLNVFANQDFVWGVGLMVSGAFISFGVMRYGSHRFREKFVNTDPETIQLGSWWSTVMTFIIPVEVVTLLAWWMYQSAAVYAPDTWYNPLSPFSVATVLLQWGIAMGILVYLNRRIVSRLRPSS